MELTCQRILAPPRRRKRKHPSATNQNSVQPTSQTTARITQIYKQGYHKRSQLVRDDESINRPIRNSKFLGLLEIPEEKRKRNRNLHSLFPSPLLIR